MKKFGALCTLLLCLASEADAQVILEHRPVVVCPPLVLYAAPVVWSPAIFRDVEYTLGSTRYVVDSNGDHWRCDPEVTVRVDHCFVRPSRPQDGPRIPFGADLAWYAAGKLHVRVGGLSMAAAFVRTPGSAPIPVWVHSIVDTVEAEVTAPEAAPAEGEWKVIPRRRVEPTPAEHPPLELPRLELPPAERYAPAPAPGPALDPFLEPTKSYEPEDEPAEPLPAPLDIDRSGPIARV